MQEFEALANRLADAAGEIVRQYFRADFEVIKKEDDSPVTIADRSVEKRLREIIEAERPNDGILGEEFGIKEGTSAYTWVIDPIDGTKSFVIGRPTFGTLIALCENDVPILGVIDQAILNERWIGVRGKETTLNNAPVTTRSCSSLDEARACSTTPAMFNDTGPAYEALGKGNEIAWGGDCYMYGLIASGHMDIAIEASLSPYDFAALVPVVEGAGGHISDWAGNPMTLQSDGRIIALGDKALWPEVSEKLKTFT